MQSPLEISWHHVDKSEALESRIREHVDKLDRFYDGIISCRVTVEQSHGRHTQGNLYNLGIELKVPDKTIVVKRDPSQHQAHEDVYVSLRDAFHAVKRQLEDYSRKRQRQVKAHANEELRQAKIDKVFPDEGYGFLRTPDARQIYFDANAVAGMQFERLSLGMDVSFIEEMGDKGPQAIRVLTGKHDTGL